jgi:hypothetical protein
LTGPECRERSMGARAELVEVALAVRGRGVSEAACPLPGTKGGVP